MRKILIILSLLSALILPLQSVNAENFTSQKENSVSWNTYGHLHFNGLTNPYLGMTIERYFADELEYKINLMGRMYWDKNIKLYKLAIVLGSSNVEVSPYSNSSIGLKNIYGVVKLKNNSDGEEYIISLLRDADNTDPVILPPGIEKVELKIEMPEEAITLEDQNDINFPNISYDNNLRIAYLPLNRIDTIVDEILYEIVIDEGIPAIITTTFDSEYLGNPLYRVIEDADAGTAKILKRVSLIEEYPNYFDDTGMDITLSEVSGLSVEDLYDHQIAISGKMMDDIKESDIVFNVSNKSSDPSVERPVQIAKFEASNGIDKITSSEEGSLDGPPVILSWLIYPETRSQIEIKNPNGYLYSGNITTMDNFEISDFTPGEYTIIAKNSLGAKEDKITINAPLDNISLYLKSVRQIDSFTTEDLLVPINNVIKFRDGKTNANIIVDVLGVPPANLNDIPLGYNQDNSYFTQILSIEALYPGFLTRYELNVSQLKSKSSTYKFEVGTNKDTEEISIKPLKKLKNQKYVFEKSQIEQITTDRKILSNIFENPDYDELISSENIDEDTLSKIENQELRDAFLNLWKEKKNIDKTDSPEVMSYNENINAKSDIATLSNESSGNNKIVYSFILLIALGLGISARLVWKENRKDI